MGGQICRSLISCRLPFTMNRRGPAGRFSTKLGPRLDLPARPAHRLPLVRRRLNRRLAMSCLKRSARIRHLRPSRPGSRPIAGQPPGNQSMGNQSMGSRLIRCRKTVSPQVPVRAMRLPGTHKLPRHRLMARNPPPRMHRQPLTRKNRQTSLLTAAPRQRRKVPFPRVRRHSWQLAIPAQFRS